MNFVYNILSQFIVFVQGRFLQSLSVFDEHVYSFRLIIVSQCHSVNDYVIPLVKRQATLVLRHNSHCDVRRDGVRAPPVCHPAVTRRAPLCLSIDQRA